ncbi:MAG: hypothetical protein GWN67_21130 [Phycisphaerae bacterium]|nr:hypothetical protein [Phycisphaerae bacterium]NIQ75404.1 hypothetical protein [Gammaproteobacteria bacterium]NIS53442.1 hypothetical protein [Phycisphaerae bacterium]NIU58790.1 hypothetical protein [Phycisphaerae bacterium]NIW95063.1 hypothetical protein [Phycisphaerae bacterium]
MRWFAHNILVGLLALCLLPTPQVYSQYELSWYTIDGGGGRSSGGPYTLTGTIGQPDAAYSKGGNYELLGGFWPGGPLCFVEFEDFARFAELWLVTGTDLPADLFEDENNIVNGLDLQVFVDYWLCYCPTDWPLK